MKSTLAAPILLALTVWLTTTELVWAQEPISEVTVIRGGNANIQPPAGYTKIAYDLNAGAGGDFIYVCYKRGVGAPITGLAVTLGSNTPPADPRYKRIDVDLNAGAGGAFIYLWTTKDPDCASVKDILVQSGQNAPPASYTPTNVDLNKGAGGQFIWLSYLKN